MSEGMKMLQARFQSPWRIDKKDVYFSFATKFCMRRNDFLHLISNLSSCIHVIQNVVFFDGFDKVGSLIY